MSDLLETIPWARRLKIRHLEVFLALDETGSMTAAAGQLHMTQPALSHWLADLEEAIGQPLFVRGRRLSLTPDGEVLRAHASRMLGDVRRTHADFLALHAGLQGRLRVGTGLPRVLLPRAIARLQQKQPGIFVSVVEASLSELLEQLARREIDLIIGALSAQALASGFATAPLRADSLQVVARSGHALLGPAGASWASMDRHPWLLPPAGSVMRAAFDEAFAMQKQRPPVPCVEAGSSIRVQLLLEERDYLTILSAAELQLYRPLGLIQRVPLSPAIPSPDIGAIWEPALGSRLVAHFVEALRSESLDLGGAD
ncbi:MAG TPA: LysR substrate-binding domain-containing protein [Ideonella sp.]|uniref:LysR family transcriptional regulator n=1 Tax=Ideonella sp. TaxID=1929293 RepID=UPI002D1D7C59|nr:LysR substrate-binding domain-containing protein [Ideonella sp.]HSI47108.1 LysR substrate-binding domain-containing protein [Ideonella sp.]